MQVNNINITPLDQYVVGSFGNVNPEAQNYPCLADYLFKFITL